MAVIVILAVIALISTPIILNIINKSKKSAFTDTAYGIVESAKLYYTEQILDGKVSSNKEFKFDGSTNELNYNGTKPKGGSLILTNKGEVSLAIHNGVWCATKAKNESKVTLKKYEESTCVVPDDMEIPATPVTPEKTFTFDEIMNESSEVMRNDPDHNPSNYVKFNDELWRIIGVFNGQAKIIRNDFYSTGIAWDMTSGHGSMGWNDWSVATLQNELNNSYFSSITLRYKAMIDENHLWNLGGMPLGNSSYTRAKFYDVERGIKAYRDHATEWTGAIGLMYASDYGYSTSFLSSECDTTMEYWNRQGKEECTNNSWLYKSSNNQWTLSSSRQVNYRVFGVYATGIVQAYSANDKVSVSPVLYLKSNVKITDGNGSAESPFELTM